MAMVDRRNLRMPSAAEQERIRRESLTGGRYAPPGTDLTVETRSDPSRRNTYYDQFRGDAANRLPCPQGKGWSRHGGKCIKTASVPADRHGNPKDPTKPRDPAPSTAAPAAPVAPSGTQPGLGPTPYPRPPANLAPARQFLTPAPYQSTVRPFAEYLDEAGAPGPYRRPSFADSLSDPRFAMGAADADRTIASASEAAGVRGAPVVASRALARHTIAGDLYGARQQEDRADHTLRFGQAFQTATGAAGIDTAKDAAAERARQYDADFAFRQLDAQEQREYQYWATRYGHDVAIALAAGNMVPHPGYEAGPQVWN